MCVDVPLRVLVGVLRRAGVVLPKQERVRWTVRQRRRAGSCLRSRRRRRRLRDCTIVFMNWCRGGRQNRRRWHGATTGQTRGCSHRNRHCDRVSAWRSHHAVTPSLDERDTRSENIVTPFRRQQQSCGESTAIEWDTWCDTRTQQRGVNAYTAQERVVYA